MFKFDMSQFRTEFCTLLNLSKATIDPRVTFLDSNGVKQRLPIPVSVARIVRARLHGVSKFANGYPCAFAFVNDRIVAMDVAIGPAYKMFKDTDCWLTCIDSQSSILHSVEGDWLYDGQYIYRPVGEVVRLGDTNFGAQDVRCYNLFKLGEEKVDIVEQRACLAYYNQQTGQWLTSAPVTRKSGGFLQITGDTDKFDRNDQFIDADSEFARINTQIFPNLRFVNYAAKVLSAQFGYDTIEPLGLPLLVIEHQTFNIGGIPTEMQAASPAPFKFMDALAWLIGLHRQVSNLNDLIAIKSTMKMLLTKGNTNQRMMGEQKQEHNTRELIQNVRAAAKSAPLVEFESGSVEDID